MGNKNIRLISTGGTIACCSTEKGLSPELCAKDMLKIIDADTQRISATDLFSLDSSNITPDDWIAIADELRKTALNTDIDGIVLTHGTDTMGYTASILSFLLCDIRVPVVITGAQTPIIEPDSDGRQNLKDAILAASELDSGVYVCFGSLCMLGCRAVKTHTRSDKAFESINFPYIAQIKNDKFISFSKPYHDQSEMFRNMTMDICNDVALIKLIPGASTKLIESVFDCGIKGLVVECFGMGGVNESSSKALTNLMKKGLKLVLTSQCLYEESSLDVYAVSRELRDAGAISARDMTTEAAVTKLMWALAQSNYSVEEIFAHNFCGERK